LKADLAELVASLQALRAETRTRFNADLVGVFGSVARGEHDPESDIDILVRFLPGASLFDLVGLGDFLEEKLGRKVDIVSERAIRPELRERIMQELVRV